MVTFYIFKNGWFRQASNIFKQPLKLYLEVLVLSQMGPN